MFFVLKCMLCAFFLESVTSFLLLEVSSSFTVYCFCLREKEKKGKDMKLAKDSKRKGQNRKKESG